MSSSPNTPLEAPPAQPLAEAIAPPVLPVEDPPWNGWDVVLMLVVTFIGLNVFVAVLMTATLAVYAAKHPGALNGPIIQQIAANPYLGLAAQCLAYLALVGFMIWLVRRRYHRPFWDTLRWNWPRQRWFTYIVSGIGLAVVVTATSAFLPIPKSLPIEQFFKSREAAYLLAIFGIFVAPPIEEVFFRGFLYPVMARAFARALNDAQKAASWSSLALVFAGWAMVTRSLTGLLLFAAALLPLVMWAIFLAGKEKETPAKPLTGLTTALSLIVWGVLMHTARPALFWMGVIAAILIAALFIGAAKRRGLPGNAAAFAGIATSITLTAAGFALVHSPQLAHSIVPLALLFGVGLVITTVRAATRSLAASLLIHVTYNLTLFTLMFFSTGHFRNLERISR